MSTTTSQASYIFNISEADEVVHRDGWDENCGLELADDCVGWHTQTIKWSARRFWH